jgi:hypothetical protein
MDRGKFILKEVKINMREILKIIYFMDKVFIFIVMEMFIEVNFFRGKNKGRVN